MPDGNGTKVPQQTDDAVLLYQVETALEKLTERSLLGTSLSVPQMMLLGALYHDGRALVPRRLRNTLVVEAQSLTGLIDRLESPSWAKRLSHPNDRRKIRVQITAKGRARYDEAAPHSDQAIADFFKPLTDRERTQFRAIMLKLRGPAFTALGLLPDRAYPPAR